MTHGHRNFPFPWLDHRLFISPDHLQRLPSARFCIFPLPYHAHPCRPISQARDMNRRSSKTRFTSLYAVHCLPPTPIKSPSATVVSQESEPRSKGVPPGIPATRRRGTETTDRPHQTTQSSTSLLGPSASSHQLHEAQHRFCPWHWERRKMLIIQRLRPGPPWISIKPSRIAPSTA